MRKLITILFMTLLPYWAYAQATPTPTATATPFRKGPEGAVRALYLPLTTIAATAVPTAYAATPSVPNTKPLRSIDFTNDMDCTVIASLDGGTADNVVVPSKSALTIDLGKLGLYHDKNINTKSTAVCNSGSLYVSGGY